MTEKELRKLNRYQLLELLVAQTERADKLQAQLEEAERQLVERELGITALGSIAEASLKLSGVFQAAQEAADRYLEAARARASQIEENARRQADTVLAQAGAELRRMK